MATILSSDMELDNIVPDALDGVKDEVDLFLTCPCDAGLSCMEHPWVRNDLSASLAGLDFGWMKNFNPSGSSDFGVDAMNKNFSPAVETPVPFTKVDFVPDGAPQFVQTTRETAPFGISGFFLPEKEQKELWNNVFAAQPFQAPADKPFGETQTPLTFGETTHVHNHSHEHIHNHARGQTKTKTKTTSRKTKAIDSDWEDRDFTDLDLYEYNPYWRYTYVGHVVTRRGIWYHWRKSHEREGTFGRVTGHYVRYSKQ